MNRAAPMRRQRLAKNHTPVDKSVLAFGQTPPLRDEPYLISLRAEPCIVTGRRATESESVVAAHIGTAGRGLKIDDDCALPIINSIHQQMHQRGEITVLRALLPDDVLRAALRALAREMYRERTR